MLRAAVVGALLVVSLPATPAVAQDWPEPERPINQPSFVDVGATYYQGEGYDGGFEGDGPGVRAGVLIGAARPRWAYLRGTYHRPGGDDPSLVQLDLQAGYSLLHSDCAQLHEGQLLAQVPAYRTDAAGHRRVRQYDARPVRRSGTFRFSGDLVLVAGARMFTFIGDNPDGSHLRPIFIGQAGLWYLQQHMLAGYPGRLRVALLGAFEAGRAAKPGVFAQVEATFLRHIYVSAEAGGMSSDRGGRELGITLGYEL